MSRISSRTLCDQFRRFVNSVSVLEPDCDIGIPKPAGKGPPPTVLGSKSDVSGRVPFSFKEFDVSIGSYIEPA